MRQAYAHTGKYPTILENVFSTLLNSTLLPVYRTLVINTFYTDHTKLQIVSNSGLENQKDKSPNLMIRRFRLFPI